MTHLHDGTTVTDLRADTDKRKPRLAGLFYPPHRDLARPRGAELHLLIYWDAPDITEADLPF